MTSPRASAHPDAATLAGYIDRRLGGPEQRAVAEHLIACAACRAGVADVSRVTRAEGARKRAIAGAVAVTGAAAVLALAVLPREVRVPAATGSAPIERAAEAGGPASIRVWSPAAAAGPSVGPASRFAWSPVRAGAQYHLSLTDAAGDEIWTMSTADTAVAFPASIELRRGQEYFWVVDALLPDGSVASSGIRQFRRGP